MSFTAAGGIAPADIRRMLELVTDTARLSGSSIAQSLHALRGVMRLTCSQVGVMARVRRVPGRPLELMAFVDMGWESEPVRQTVIEAALQPGYSDLVLEGGMEQLGGRPSRPHTFLRQNIMPDSDWYNSSHFNEFRREGRIDDCAYSIFPLAQTGEYACLGLHRGLTDATRYTERDRQMVDYVWQSLAWLHETPASIEVSGSPKPLDADLLPVLRLLKAPGSLASAPRKLGMTRAEFHRKCSAVYAHFEVSGRLELLLKLVSEQ